MAKKKTAAKQKRHTPLSSLKPSTSNGSADAVLSATVSPAASPVPLTPPSPSPTPEPEEDDTGKRAEKMKDQGNVAFKAAKYADAIDLYTSAIGSHGLLSLVSLLKPLSMQNSILSSLLILPIEQPHIWPSNVSVQLSRTAKRPLLFNLPRHRPKLFSALPSANWLSAPRHLRFPPSVLYWPSIPKILRLSS